MMDILEKVEKLKAELDALRPLGSDAEGRVMQKFRLDWNYHSNSIEGNSLTYGETKALILFGVTAQGKPLKDHFEISGHNEAISWVLDLVKGETPLTEKFIRELHVLLLKEDQYIDAVTEDGIPTRRLVTVGKYKSAPNHVKTVTGEIFYFVSPEDTAPKMQELLERINKEMEKPEVSAVFLASAFHYEFIRIHPFDDGNGRTARIVMNFILMRFGYPPVIIRAEDKENYFSALTLADAGQIEPFIQYIATNMLRSLDIMVRGAKGEDIEEPEDFEKEIAILEKKIRSVGVSVTAVKSVESLVDILSTSVGPAIESFRRICQKFDRFYLDKSLLVQANPNFEAIVTMDAGTIRSYIKQAIEKSGGKINELKQRYSHSTFNQPDIGDFNYGVTLTIRFGVTTFDLTLESDNLFYQAKPSLQRPAVVPLFKHLYSEQLSEEDLKFLERSLIKDHKEYIDKKYDDWKSTIYQKNEP